MMNFQLKFVSELRELRDGGVGNQWGFADKLPVVIELGEHNCDRKIASP